MGCASSKRIEATVPVYHPPPASFAVFDINAVEEPWIKHLNQFPDDHEENKPVLPPQILQKLNMLDATDAPQSWEQVSKTLQDLKPIIVQQPQPPRKVASFHTLEELDSKLVSQSPPKPTPNNSRKKESIKLDDDEAKIIKPVKENIFILKDRLERQKEEKESNYEERLRRRNPLSEYPEKCPPGGNDSVVIYTTSLGGVRKTFDDCNRARDLLENHRVVFDERDVALHGGFLKEVKELLEGGGVVMLPKVFVKGRYLGGLEELLELNETGRLGRILNASRVERGFGRLGCGGCGGARFVPCFDCGGSCKLPGGGNGLTLIRCPNCNENGLVHCPSCL